MQFGPASIFYGLAQLLLTVESAYFTQSQWAIHLPFEYPLKVPFVQVAAVNNKSDANLTWQYCIRKARMSNLFHVSTTGQLSLAKKTARKEISVVISLDIPNSNSSCNDMTKPSTKIQVTFDQSPWNVPENQAELCFLKSTNPWKLSLNENDQPQHLSLAFLHHHMYPNVTIHYSIASDIFYADPKTGEISAKQPFDYEVSNPKSWEFSLECALEENNMKSNQILKIGLRLLDVNDMAPHLKNGDTIDFNLTKNIPVGQSLELPHQIFIEDNDTIESEYTFELIDPKNLFYASLDKITGLKRNLYVATLKVARRLEFEGDVYRVSLKIIDTGLLPIYETKPAVVNITIYNFIQNDDIREHYFVTVPQDSTKYKRILGPIHTNSKTPHDIIFALTHENEKYKIFDVTPTQGIVFVRNPQGLQNFSPNSSLKCFLNWKSKSDPSFSNLSVISITISGPLENFNDSKNGSCDEIDTCAIKGNEDECIRSCGLGIRGQTCSWKTFRTHRTCVNDKVTCDNEECDELEAMDWHICPQDCTAKAIPKPKEENRIGINYDKAVGKCICDPTIQLCTCYSAHHVTEPLNTIHTAGSTASVNYVNPYDMNDTNQSYSMKPVVKPINNADTLAERQCDGMCLFAIFFGLVMIVIVMLGVIFWRLRMRRKGRSGKPKYLGSAMSLSAMPSDYVGERSSSVISQTINVNNHLGLIKFNIPIDNKWEISKSRLIIKDTIGEGEFGKVMRAKLFGDGGEQDSYTIVAVKTLKNNGTSSELQDLLSEYNLLKEVSHPNVIKLLGASTPRDGPLCIVVEFAEHGSLRSFLRKSRQLEFATYASEDSGVGSLFLGSQNGSILSREYQVSSRDLLSFMWQISKGMAYLSDMKVVHRDLAARNILVAAGRVIKISDFGLSRDVYEGDAYFKTSKGRVPVKWLALESLLNHVYTSKSDVWSFGIVIWEIVMLGASPYPGIPAERLFYLLRNGYRMEKPENCSDELYNIMRLCWRENPQERPCFKELMNKFERMLQENVEYLDLSLNMVHNLAYFESRSIKADDEDEDDSDIHYGSLNIVSTDDNEYLSRKRQENSESTCLLPLTSEDVSDCPLDEMEAVV